MSTITQTEVVIETPSGTKIKVRRMNWGASKKFLRLFAKAIKLLYAGKKSKFAQLIDSAKAVFKEESEKEAAEKAAEKASEQLFEVLEEVVQSADDLATHLARHSAGMEEKDFDALDFVTGLDVLAAAISINFDEQLKKSLAGIASSVRGLIPAPEKTN